MNIFKKSIQTLLLIIILTVIIGIADRPIFAAPNAEIGQLTNTLLELNKATPKDSTEMLQVATKREKLLFQEAKDNPSSFAENATLLEERKDFPVNIQPYIEELVTKEGELLVIYLENKNKAEIDYKLTSNVDKTIYDLNFVKTTPDLQTGAKVSAKGILINKQLVVLDTVTPIESGFRSLAVTASPGFGEQKTLILLVNFTNDTSENITESEVQEMIFTGANSVNEFYKENSFNQTFLTGEVHGWYTVSYDNTQCDNNYFLWSNEADAAAVEDGIILSNFDRLVYVFPRPQGCSFSGLGSIGGVPSRSWILGFEHDEALYAHEFGHNIGLHHSNSLKCGNKAIDDYSNCFQEEYGDYFDVMGNFWVVNASMLHFNAAHKVAVGWIPGERVQNITTPGIYKVYHIETGNSLPQALTIDKPDTSETYYLSYRQPLGFDSTLVEGITRGTSVHVWNNLPFVQTKFLDTTPGTGDFSGMGDATLADTKKFTDSTNKIEVIQKSHTAEYSEVEVKFGISNSPTPTRSPTPTKKPDDIDPKISMTYPTNNSKVPRNKSITLKATATDNVKVVKVQFKRNGKIICTDDSLPFTCLSFTNYSKNKRITYEAKAFDAVGNDRRSVVTVTTQ